LIAMPNASHGGVHIRRRRLAILISVVLLVPVTIPTIAAPAVTVETAAQEIVEVATATGAVMQVRVFRPTGKGPFPLAIVNHGSPVDASERRAMEVPTFPIASNWLLARGYAVALPLRRGYGETGGPWVEGYGSCRNPDYYRAGLATADDIQSVMDFLRDRSDLERGHILLLGWSAGGWGSIAAASRHPRGVFAVVNLAGGRGGNPAAGNCTAERLVAAAGRYGETARIPSVWLYSANDRFFGPDLSRAMFDAYVGAGGRAEYVSLPAFGTDGHRIFRAADARALWQPPVEKFLAALKP
jgi:dienelactone hydrolase